MILNVTVSGHNVDNGLSLAGGDFYLYRKWSLKDEKDDEYFDMAGHKNINDLLLDGKEQPIINILKEGYEVSGNTPPRTFNIVMDKPNKTAFDIVYQGFYYSFNKKPSSSDDTSFVLHVKEKQLEELTNG